MTTPAPKPQSAPVNDRIGVVLGQIGAPQELSTKAIRAYLKEFLSDERIIDRPRWQWFPILYGLVLPNWPKRVVKQHAEIWMDEGSPLLITSEAQRDGIQERLGDRYQVELGLAYSEPSMARAVRNLEEAGIRKIVVLPLFPQYSNSTTASIYDAIMFNALGRGRRRRLPVKKYSPTLRFIHPYFNDPDYIKVLASSVDRQLAAGTAPDRIVISFHGVPQNFVDEGDPYRTQCEETTRLLAEALDWPAGSYEMAFQSRFGRTEWIKPYLQPRLGELYDDGVERPAIVSPGFTTDCLETLHEIAIDGRDLFRKGGGDPAKYRTVDCLNAEPEWLDYAAALIEKNSGGW